MGKGERKGKLQKNGRREMEQNEQIGTLTRGVNTPHGVCGD